MWPLRAFGHSSPESKTEQQDTEAVASSAAPLLLIKDFRLVSGHDAVGLRMGRMIGRGEC